MKFIDFSLLLTVKIHLVEVSTLSGQVKINDSISFYSLAPHIKGNPHESGGKFLIPLFRTMGYSLVDYSHGPLEAGKDLILLDEDRMHHWRYRMDLLWDEYDYFKHYFEVLAEKFRKIEDALTLEMREQPKLEKLWVPVNLSESVTEEVTLPDTGEERVQIIPMHDEILNLIENFLTIFLL